MIEKVLVANRSEIALRIFRACHEAGISTVAVYSDADAGSPHVEAADMAVRLPGERPAHTYLRGDLAVRAAIDVGADAVHPGYGFLSESAEFARQVMRSGLTWIGPSPDAIETMGSKVRSKRLMADAGVPVLPDLDPDEVSTDDTPVLVKASAGGGGRGMRVARTVAELPDAVRSARAEAESAFGDPRVFCEHYLDTGRHIEVQVVADTHGTVWTVGERECSIQRRHQKVVEEAPSPLVDPAMRAELFDAAGKAAKAINYVGAGTVEFLATEDGNFYFLEMNTRLQVEHPVTECTTGLDLVALQIQIAEGEHLSAEPPGIRGHAIEVRLYAENPAEGWRPQSGVLERFEIPAVTSEFGVRPTATVTEQRGIRLDSGVLTGSTIGVHYDPLLAKVIAWASNRRGAARMLASALANAKVHGVVTNRDLLVNVLRHPAFLAGETDTAFFERHGLDRLAAPLADARTTRLAVLAAALADAAANRVNAVVGAGLPSGWRNVVAMPQCKEYTVGGVVHEVAYRLSRAGLVAEGYEGVELISASPDRVVLDVAGVRETFTVAGYGSLVCVDSVHGSVSLTRVPRFRDRETELTAGSLVAPMPGTVVRVAVSVGEAVRAGQPLLSLEAMKMEHAVRAPVDGVVGELPVGEGHTVDVGTVLAIVRESDNASEDAPRP